MRTDTPPTTGYYATVPPKHVPLLNQRPHLIGWGEDAPAIYDRECRICHAPAGGIHHIVMLGHDQTLDLLVEFREANPA